MLAYVRLIQSREKELGVEVLTHQKWSGAPYMDGILGAIQSGSSSSKSMGEGNTEKGKLSIHFDLLAINANNPKLQASKQIPRHGRIIIMPSVLLDRCRDRKKIPIVHQSCLESALNFNDYYHHPKFYRTPRTLSLFGLNLSS